ncbi:hypothetical protein AFEL58S_03927 [Afipia felis]
MSLLIRLLLFLAAPITALFVSRDALNFSVIQTFVATGLAVVIVFAFAFWPFGPKTREKAKE